MPANPAASVRGPSHVVTRGKTPVLSPEEARRVLDAIDVSTHAGLRDRALIALMTFSFARVGAAVGMRVEDYFADGKRWRLRLNEKGGKVHEMPAHHNLEAYLDAYMHAAELFGAKGTPLFRSADWHGGALTNLPMHRVVAAPGGSLHNLWNRSGRASDQFARRTRRSAVR